MRRRDGGTNRRRRRRCGVKTPSVAGGAVLRLAGAAPAGVLTHSTHSGGVGTPPGDTTIPRQELADVDVGSFRPVWTLASGMGQIP